MGGNDDNFRRKFWCGMSRRDGSTRALSPKETITLDEYPTEPPCVGTVGLSKVYALRAK